MRTTSGVGGTPTGIGDPCTKATDCASIAGSKVACAFHTPPQGLPGWCTASCQVEGSADSLCGGVYYNGTNKFGEPNYCLGDLAGNLACYPGCTNSPGSCGNYVGATCNPASGGVNACW